MLPDKVDLILRDLKEKTFEQKIPLKKWKIQEVKKDNKNQYNPIEEKNIFLTGNDSFWDNTGKIFFFMNSINLNEKYDNPYLYLDIDGECTLYLNNKVYRGINEKEIKLPSVNDDSYYFKILATHDVHLSAKHQRMYNKPYPPHLFREAFVYNKNNEVEKLYVLIKNIKNAIEVIDEKEKSKLENIMENGIKKIDFFTSNKNVFKRSVNTSYDYMIISLDKININDRNGKVFALGHSHLDIAFKWTISDTIRKLERTISTTLNLIDNYDDYYFIQAQAILYDYLKEYYPELFNKLKAKLKQKQFIIDGSLWVEPDLNLTHGESLIRQILYAKKFFENHFNIETKIAWLPDSFGFSAILPQILKKSNIDYFITTKLQWNDTNEFPYNIFKWEGIDGSQIQSYLLSDTYGGNLEPKKIYDAYNNRKQKDIEEVLSLYGYGDGGGGNTESQLNNLNEMTNIPYLPEIKTGNIYDHLEKIFDKDNLPIWNDELYLEKHRGTYTTQAKLKKYNRKLEFLLINTEFLYSFAHLKGINLEVNFEKLWKVLLKNQFHDILPGSCIEEVYNEAIDDYKDLEENLVNIKNNIFEFLTKKSQTTSDHLFIFNPHSFNMDNILSIKKEYLNDNYNSIKINEKIYPLQIDENYIYFQTKNINPFQIKKVKLLKESTKIKNNLQSSNYHLENKYLKISFDENGRIYSIYDKEQNIEYVENNEFVNRLKLYDDKSTYFDSWDLSISEDNKKYIDQLEYIKIKEKGPFFHSIILKRKFYNSSITQEIRLFDNKRKVDFKTKVDWNQRQQLLKTSFPLNIKNSEALFDLSMGYIKRDNYKNDSWSKAKTEVPAHKWVNLNNDKLSISLLNDCKYGHNISKNVINLTLLKGGIYPDPKADLGEHEFTYSLLLSPKPIDIVSIEKNAMQLNNKPLYYFPKETKLKNDSNQISLESIININNENITIDSFKLAEDNKGYILRFHEFAGKKTNVKLSFNENINKIIETDLMENNIKILTKSNELKLNPFEIKTLKIFLR
ncbi:MAG: glycoside hydrolase family 38 C-terminal domain-containing protein [Halanaerobiales bacterium]|nr:glycoside hydrolase family 38 C-terminal domain-containing protein [Halanaerobiales bacterium]